MTNSKNEHPYCFHKASEDILPQGIVINDYEDLSDPDELVRLKEILELHFELLGKSVVTTNKEKVGKVSDFAADSQTLFVQKLYVNQSILKSLNTGQLSIDRNQIIEITNKKIIIKELLQPIRSGVRTSAQAA
jgi:sporulation protein YlmC with PRC-barrel domain